MKPEPTKIRRTFLKVIVPSVGVALIAGGILAVFWTNEGGKVPGVPEVQPVALKDPIAEEPRRHRESIGQFYRGAEEATTPQAAEAMLASARRIPDVFKRMAKCTEIISTLCGARYVDEAWELIETDPGQVRTSQLLRFFRVAGLDVPRFLEKWRTLPFKEEPGIALQGYFKSLEKKEMELLIKDPGFQQALAALEKDHAGLLSRSLTASMTSTLSLPGDAADKKEAVEQAAEYHREGWLDDNGLANVLKADKGRGSFEKWEQLTAAVETAPQNSLASMVRREFIWEMVEADAMKALHRISERGSENQGHVDLFNGLKKWGAGDPVAANRWFADHRSGMDQVQRDASARAFFELALHHGEPDGAEQWARQVANEKLKELLLAKLEEPK